MLHERSGTPPIFESMVQAKTHPRLDQRVSPQQTVAGSLLMLMDLNFIAADKYVGAQNLSLFLSSPLAHKSCRTRDP